MEFFIQGLIVCFGLIVSIGAQNAFLLKQGILKQHVFAVALICFLGDVFLMTVGVLGLGELISRLSVVSLLLAILGAVFLFTYGSRSFLNIFKADGALTQSSENITSLKRILMVTFAVTFLNPHVYIDMVAILCDWRKTRFQRENCFFIWSIKLLIHLVFWDRLWSGIFCPLPC